MNQTDKSVTEVGVDHEHKLAIDWDYRNTIEDCSFVYMASTKSNDAADIARFPVLMLNIE